MEKQHVLELLTGVRSGLISPEDALEKLALLPYEDLSFAKLDHHRAIRTGFPEVVFGEGKTAIQIVGIVDSLARNNATVLVTRTSEQAQTAIAERFPDAIYNTTARTIVVNQRKQHLKGGVLVVTAGTKVNKCTLVNLNLKVLAVGNATNIGRNNMHVAVGCSNMGCLHSSDYACLK